MASGPSISVVLVRPLVAALEPNLRAAFFKATDLTPKLLEDADARVSPSQFCVAWAETTRLSGNESLALQIAEAMPPGAFGIVEYVCRSAPTLGAALEQWVRYLGIIDDAVEVELIRQGTTASLKVVLESEAPAPASHELCFALIVRHARALVESDVRVQEVRFSHELSPAQLARCRAYFGAPVQTGTSHTELILPADLLDVPLSTADPNLLSILLPTAEEKRGANVCLTLKEQVSRTIRLAQTGDDTQLEVVAGRLGMSPRTLQRRLRQEGVVFQTLRDTVRKELADHYLGQGLSLAEISFLLGFSEPSAFFRAFKRWTGLTPLERRAHLGLARA